LTIGTTNRAIYTAGSAPSYFGGNIGIKATNPDSTLHIVGGLKLVTGSQANGKVLMSDATGGASWRNVTSSVDSALFRTTANSRTLAQTQTALNLKANLISPTFKGAITISEGGQSAVLQGYTGGLRVAAAGSGATGGSRGDIIAGAATFSGVQTYENLGLSGDVIIGANNSGIASKIAIGSGLSLSSGTLTATGGSAGTVTGSGTAGKITKWNSASDIGDATSLTISGSDLQVAGVVQGTRLTSTVATGTAPFTVTSTTPVTNLSIGGNASTVTTNANLTGSVTSVGNATSLGSFTSANLSTALTNETGTGSAVFGTTPTFTGTATISEGGQSVVLQGYTGGLRVAAAGSGATGGARGDLLAGAGDFSGAVTASNLSGTNTGDQTTVTGNAGTATALQTARTISGTSFNGTANITLNNTGITNGAGYITGITSGNVTTALGFTPYNATNPSGYITSSALSPYATLASPALTGAPTAPTQTAGDNSTKIATTAYVDASVGSTSSGTFAPTLSNSSNITSSAIIGTPTYIAVGNTVHCSMTVNITPTSSGSNTLLYFTLPFNAATVNTFSGIGISAAVTQSGVIQYQSSTEGKITFTSNTTSVNTFYLQFDYTK